jgi:hypothetical protein
MDSLTQCSLTGGARLLPVNILISVSDKAWLDSHAFFMPAVTEEGAEVEAPLEWVHFIYWSRIGKGPQRRRAGAPKAARGSGDEDVVPLDVEVILQMAQLTTAGDMEDYEEDDEMRGRGGGGGGGGGGSGTRVSALR